MATGIFIYVVCAAVYTTLASLIAIQARSRTNWLLAACCLVTAGWAVAAAVGTSTVWPDPESNSISATADLIRALAWYGFVLHLYFHSGIGSRPQRGAFVALGVAAVMLGVASVAQQHFAPPVAVTLWSLPMLVRLGLAIGELLLIENLYLNLPEHMRWHVAVPCVLLGALACFDILLCADLILFHTPSAPLVGARAIVTVMIAPLLVLASFRGQRWDGQVKLSRTAVFHSATLILSGGVLLSLAAAGEVFRHFGPEWGWMAETSLVSAGLIGLALLLLSRSARSRIQRLVVQHFFADRYDYRMQWLGCIDALSGTGEDGRTALHTRAIRAMADVVDSPNGALYLRDSGIGAFGWAGSWNMPATAPLPAEHPVTLAARSGDWIVDLGKLNPEDSRVPPLNQLGRIWLAIPLVHRAELIGIVVVGPPRAPFRTDQEVFDLLRIVGREVATYIAEQRATQVMVQTRHLHDYSKRFAFVAHDIKNVSSQLALLLRNAEHHISNPEFQKDMLETVGASVQKISLLLKRLEAPEADHAPAALTPLPRLEALIATYRRVRRADLKLDHDGSTATVAMSADAFDTAVTHLLNNAVEASGGLPVQVLVRHEVSQVVIDIVDEGSGMTPEFVRDNLFRPFSTQKRGGSGIGAFQARELVRESGGDLLVISQQSVGTTMRIILPRADKPVEADTAAGPSMAQAQL